MALSLPSLSSANTATMTTSLPSLHSVAGRVIGYISQHVNGGVIPTTAEKGVSSLLIFVPFLFSFRVISYLFSLTVVSLFDCIVWFSNLSFLLSYLTGWYVLYSTLLHVSSLRLHCVGGCEPRTVVASALAVRRSNHMAIEHLRICFSLFIFFILKIT